MKGKKLDLLFLCLCAALCLVLSLGTALFGPSQARANEILAAAPKLKSADGLNTGFLSDVSDWLSDRFFLRQELVTVHNRALTALGGGAANDVIAGKDGWLYYAPTLDDYTGVGAMNASELAAAARNLSLMRQSLAEKGVGFLFVPVPNKNSLYDAAMPSCGEKAAEHDAERLLRLLEAEGVPCADLFSAFRAQPETLYFAHDSHWNSRGAALAADEIDRCLGRESDYFSADFSGKTAHAGDLYEMRYPAGTDGETDLVYGGTLDYVREGTDTRPDAITINTSGGGEGTLLMFRDSFGNSLYPYLADSFGSARFSRATAYDLTLAGKLGADCVVVELVERNLRYLLRFTPLTPAPVREEPPYAASDGGAVALTVSAPGQAPEGCSLFRGTLPAELAGARVLLCAGGAAREAFTDGAGGFSAWLPSDFSPESVLALDENGAARFRAVLP